MPVLDKSEPWNSNAPSGWSHSSPTTNASIVTTDANFPAQLIGDKSNPANVLKSVIPAGTAGGSGSVDYSRALGTARRFIYWRSILKIGTDWVPHSSGINKLGFAYTNGSPKLFLLGFGTGTMRLRMGMQSLTSFTGQTLSGGAINLQGNLANMALTLGVWYVIEVLASSNSANGVADGSIEVWLNAQKTHEFLNKIEWNTGGAAYTFDTVQRSLVWGGGGGTVAADMTVYAARDHIERDSVPFTRVYRQFSGAFGALRAA